MPLEDPVLLTILLQIVLSQDPTDDEKDKSSTTLGLLALPPPPLKLVAQSKLMPRM
jgi:hypothetical protein